MELTPNLKLPCIVAAQAQKHVTHNDVISAPDVVAQISVNDRDITGPRTQVFLDPRLKQ
ncbi:hypothetical protein [Ralstonia sp.]|uniref:hypothetical protein n=1 Tax=Ralstonia sp. TaxID=54061 RepID=UPI00257D2373|nr:hypothetical protein [Ralstonia sp.]